MGALVKSDALAFLWVPAFAGMTVDFADVSLREKGEDLSAPAQRREGEAQ